MKMKNNFHGAMKKKKNSANQNSSICMKTTDIKLLPRQTIFCDIWTENVASRLHHKVNVYSRTMNDGQWIALPYHYRKSLS